jgi:hypothetical protein
MGVEVKLHGTVTISRISHFFDRVNVIFNDNALPTASWGTSRGSGFTWQTPTIGTNPNSYDSQIRFANTPASYWWSLRGYFGGCVWELRVEASAWRTYTYTVRTSSGTLASGTFNTNGNGVRASFSF